MSLPPTDLQLGYTCMQGYFKYGEDQGLPAGHESLHCLSSQVPRWIGDPVYADKVTQHPIQTHMSFMSAKDLLNRVALFLFSSQIDFTASGHWNL